MMVAVLVSRALALSATVLCGSLMVWSFALLFSNLAMLRPNTVIASWERGESMSDHHQRRQLQARMAHAVAVNPMNAQQRLQLGRFFAWHAVRHRAGSRRAVFYNQLASQRFAEAVLARPTWGFAWVLLAEQWAMSGQPRQDVHRALHRAVDLSPSEPGTQLKCLWLGLANWNALDEALQAKLTASLALLTAQRAYFTQAAEVALHHQQLAMLRRVANHPWQVERLAQLLPPSGR